MKHARLGTPSLPPSAFALTFHAESIRFALGIVAALAVLALFVLTIHALVRQPALLMLPKTRKVARSRLALRSRLARLAFSIHKWAGLATGVLFALTATMGAVLLFTEDANLRQQLPVAVVLVALAGTGFWIYRGAIRGLFRWRVNSSRCASSSLAWLHKWTGLWSLALMVIKDGAEILAEANCDELASRTPRWG